jgi:hypothetical protein
LPAVPDEFARGLRNAAWSAGLHPRQAAVLHDWFTAEMAEGQRAEGREAERKQTALLRDMEGAWGRERDTRLAYAKRAARAYGFDQAQLSHLESVVGGFNMLRTLSSMGENLRESTIEGRGSGTGISPAEAKAELQRLHASMKDATSALMDKAHPEHKTTLDRLTVLHRIAAAK